MLALMSIFKRQNMEVHVLMDSYIPIKSIKTSKERKKIHSKFRTVVTFKGGTEQL